MRGRFLCRLIVRLVPSLARPCPIRVSTCNARSPSAHSASSKFPLSFSLLARLPQIRHGFEELAPRWKLEKLITARELEAVLVGASS